MGKTFWSFLLIILYAYGSQAQARPNLCLPLFYDLNRPSVSKLNSFATRFYNKRLELLQSSNNEQVRKQIGDFPIFRPIPFLAFAKSSFLKARFLLSREFHSQEENTLSYYKSYPEQESALTKEIDDLIYEVEHLTQIGKLNYRQWTYLAFKVSVVNSIVSSESWSHTLDQQVKLAHHPKYTFEQKQALLYENTQRVIRLLTDFDAFNYWERLIRHYGENIFSLNRLPLYISGNFSLHEPPQQFISKGFQPITIESEPKIVDGKILLPFESFTLNIKNALQSPVNGQKSDPYLQPDTFSSIYQYLASRDKLTREFLLFLTYKTAQQPPSIQEHINTILSSFSRLDSPLLTPFQLALKVESLSQEIEKKALPEKDYEDYMKALSLLRSLSHWTST